MSEYKRTLFDKLGPEAADLYKIGSWMIVPIVAGAGVGGALATREGIVGVGVVLAVVIGAVLGAAGTALFVLSVSGGVGNAFRSFIQPSGNRTPYERQFSYEDSLVMRGDVAGALASYERIIAESPKEAQPRLRAAEVCLSSKLNEKAELLFRSVQRLPRVTARDDVYASHRLVDLYRTWPGNETKGLRELRRLIDTYPDTDIAARARDGLVTLKSQLGITE
ncbi:MAG TPA: tetratricopeptide repeat protein [Gemmatimonadaceae bacterium]|nr:tetratricopeptide repeat protein [Gemmatimonadaceae bacterium]